jgi:signal transduction histidine kinase
VVTGSSPVSPTTFLFDGLAVKSSSFNSRVLRLILISVIPSFIFLGTLSVILARQKVESSQSGLEMTATAISAAIDQRISSVISALHIILVTEKDDLGMGDLRHLHERLKKAAEGQLDWVSIAYLALDGSQIFNTLKPYGQEAPKLKDEEFFQRVSLTKEIVVSNIRMGRIIKRPIVSITVPVKKEGRVIGYLFGSLEPSSFSKILQDQNLRKGWTAALIDGQGKIIARSRTPETFIGKSVTPILKKRVLSAKEGVFEDNNLEGQPSMGFLKKSSLSGWSIAVGMPGGEATTAFFNTLWIVLFAGVIFLVLGVFLSYEFSGIITTPIRSLAMAAEKLGTGKEINIPDSSIQEIQDVGQALMAAAETSKKAIELRDTFLSVASHELKTPLSALSLNLTLIEREMGDNLNEKLKHRLVRGKNQVKRLNDLIEDLLDVSRISSGKLAMNMEDAQLDQLAEEVLAQFEGNSIQVSLSPTKVRADTGRIEQIILNLLTNAYRYGGGKKVELKVWSSETHAFLSVRDQGPGIKDVDQERIFQKFDQAQNKSSSKGLGLGLWISRQIAEAHKGSLSVESREKEGATFTLKLPLLS